MPMQDRNARRQGAEGNEHSARRIASAALEHLLILHSRLMKGSAAREEQS